MSSTPKTTVLYASAISASQLIGAKPEDAGELKHHEKGKKGFTNPWDSFELLPVWRFAFSIPW
jgi:N-acyl-phosphatidylethanolamine-hydrolysing phospholipase D